MRHWIKTALTCFSLERTEKERWSFFRSKPTPQYLSGLNGQREKNEVPYLESGVGYQATDTSLAAAVSAKLSARTIRTKVLRLLKIAGEPLSSEDIADHLKLPYRSVQPRLAELRNDGLVEDSGERGLSIYGKKIILWKLTNDA